MYLCLVQHNITMHIYLTKRSKSERARAGSGAAWPAVACRRRGGSWSRAAGKQCCFSKPHASAQIDEQERRCLRALDAFPAIAAAAVVA
jgi:hypothetical protein